jgi:hypothetical protein
LLIMLEVGTRSVRHFWQRRWAVGRVVRNEVGCGGEVEGDVVVVDSLRAEERRRKGMLGKR